MPALNYKIMAFGPQMAATATAPHAVAIAGVAKKASPQEPFIVANELVCADIARFLMLPCPPGAVLENGGASYYFSLDFNLAGQALPPIDPVALVAAHPRLAWGIVAFDALVMNGDRHTGNLAWDQPTDRVQVFDHSHALLRPQGDVPALLITNATQLALGGHCLAGELVSPDGLDDWLERISKIPDFYIEETVARAVEYGFPDPNRQEFVTFLKSRRDNLGALFDANRGAFPKVVW